MRQPFERLLVGRKLAGRYELEEAIGAGGMSVVYRGTDRVLGRPVAVKVVALPADSDEARENLRERFRREAGSAARIAHHPNVVQVYDYGTDAELDLDFIVMELLRGRDLKEALRQGPVPRAEALRILGDAARGLAAGHREGIVHRDVKPANVFLVGEDGQVEYVRILDFGIAKPMEPDEDSLTLTGIGQLPHSPAYASPEQLDPDAPVTPASDVYQLGLIGYELLAGARPYADAERQRIRAGEEVAPPETAAWAAVEPPLREVIARALRRDPAERYPDAGAFADALDAADGAAPSDAAPSDDDDDATVLLPAAAPLGATDALAAVPPGAPPVVPVPVEPVSSEPLSLPSPAVPARHFRPAALGIPVVLVLLALAVWATRRQPASRTAAVAADTGDVSALHDRFLRLQGEVAGGVPGSAAAESAAAAPDTASSVQEREAAQRQDAAAVQAEVIDLHAAWAAGDLDRVMRHYADRVDYFGVEGAPKSFVRRNIARTVEQYPRRTITIDGQATVFDRPDLARVLVTKEWDFGGGREHWTGSMRQELMLRLSGGEWRIVSEKSNEVFRQSRTPE
ncbi:MAG: protein kinase domain-containing protein [Longimicrobiaceae bacterium]